MKAQCVYLYLNETWSCKIYNVCERKNQIDKCNFALTWVFIQISWTLLDCYWLTKQKVPSKTTPLVGWFVACYTKLVQQTKKHFRVGLELIELTKQIQSSLYQARLSSQSITLEHVHLKMWHLRWTAYHPKYGEQQIDSHWKSLHEIGYRLLKQTKQSCIFHLFCFSMLANLCPSWIQVSKNYFFHIVHIIQQNCSIVLEHKLAMMKQSWW